MARIKLEFPNQQGQRLAGLLETPPPGIRTLGCGLFAHCFTCGKDIAAASRISRALAARGIAVLRFDFTGLGNSDGDFANTNFSSNVADLLAAADALRRDFGPPRLLIGHSLGGAAVLVAGHQVPEAEALVTIGAPATATHVRHLFSHAETELSLRGQAEVRIGRRRFRIRKEFLDDLERHTTAAHIGRLRKALLLFHSPMDDVVAISEAFAIYQAAKHPKSFISLDRADHLLTDPVDAIYVAETIVAWASRYLGLLSQSREPSQGTIPTLALGEVVVRELGESGLQGLYSHCYQLTACAPDAAPDASQLAPTPELLMRMAMAAHVSQAVRKAAVQANLSLDDVEIRVLPASPEDDAEHLQAITQPSAGNAPRCLVRLTGALSQRERELLLTKAECAYLAQSVMPGRLIMELEDP